MKMASGQQLARLFQRSCSIFNHNATKILNGASCSCRVTCKKYSAGSFSVNRYLHTTLSQLQNTKQHLSTAAALQKQSDDGTENRELVVSKVNETLFKEDLGRLFAVVHFQGKQRKVTAEDLLVVEGLFYPSVGDKIRLEKVLLVGGKDFTLVGRPLLSRNQVKIEATVIEKRLSQFIVRFDYKPRRNKLKRFNLNRHQQAVLLINSIEVNTVPES